MDRIYNKIVSAGFVDKFKRGGTLVVHGVPGCGKTRLLKEIIEEFDFVVCFTAGSETYKSQLGSEISKVSEDSVVPEGKIGILDEYNIFKGDLQKFKVLIGDPYQSIHKSLSCNLLNLESKRFGKETCLLLSNLNFKVKSQKVDKVKIENIFPSEPVGQVICLDSEVETLCKSYHLDYLNPCEAQGKTFKEVTVLTSTQLSKVPRVPLYIALTRHSDLLLILTPYPDNAIGGTS
ncbi:triple gene block 1 [Dioscorea virus A]|nr:triple gene block 1 [Dioscorea virus A]